MKSKFQNIIFQIKNFLSSIFSKKEIEDSEDEEIDIITGDILKGKITTEPPKIENQPEVISPDEIPVSVEPEFKKKYIAVLILVLFGITLVYFFLTNIYKKEYPYIVQSEISGIQLEDDGLHVFITLDIIKSPKYNGDVEFSQFKLISETCIPLKTNLGKNFGTVTLDCVLKSKDDIETPIKVDFSFNLKTVKFFFPITREIKSNFTFVVNEIFPRAEIVSEKNETLNNYIEFTNNISIYFDKENLREYNVDITYRVDVFCDNENVKVSFNPGIIHLSSEEHRKFILLNVKIPKYLNSSFVTCYIRLTYLGISNNVLELSYNLMTIKKTEKIKINSLIDYEFYSKNSGNVILQLNISSTNNTLIDNIKLYLEPYDILLGTIGPIYVEKEFNKKYSFNLSEDIVKLITENITSKYMWFKLEIEYEINGEKQIYSYTKPIEYYSLNFTTHYNISNKTVIELLINTKCSKKVNISFYVTNVSLKIPSIDYFKGRTVQKYIECNNLTLIGHFELNETFSGKLRSYLLKYNYTFIEWEVEIYTITDKEKIRRLEKILTPIFMKFEIINNTNNTINESIPPIPSNNNTSNNNISNASETESPAPPIPP